VSSTEASGIHVIKPEVYRRAERLRRVGPRRYRNVATLSINFPLSTVFKPTAKGLKQYLYIAFGEKQVVINNIKQLSLVTSMLMQTCYDA
jgi:hypothetical protein